MNPHFLFTKEEKKSIRDIIQDIESKAHTKIAIHIARRHKGNLYDAALKEFSRKELHHDKIKTGILVFISLQPHQFQLLGDEHIHEKIGNDGWSRLAADLSRHFKEGRFCDGILELLDSLKGRLVTHFPKN